MADDEADARFAHLRSVTITVAASMAGVLSAVLSAVVTADLPRAEAAADISALAMLLLAILIQIPFYKLIGFEEFGGFKDVLFVAFMTFAFWFVTFGIILTTGIEFI